MKPGMEMGNKANVPSAEFNRERGLNSSVFPDITAKARATASTAPGQQMKSEHFSEISSSSNGGTHQIHPLPVQLHLGRGQEPPRVQS